MQSVEIAIKGPGKAQIIEKHIEHKIYHVEILTPRQDAADLDASIEKFVEKYGMVCDAGYVVSVPDNPMGCLHFQMLELISELDLPVKPEQTIMHINTFHRKQDFDAALKQAADSGLRNLLVISGDGSERLPKLKPEDIGCAGNSITSVELLDYIHRAFPGIFTCGVAFNPYEPQDHELEKMRRKVDAGAAFVTTQPVLGMDERVLALKQFGLPIVVGAWMSKKIHLLSECVGYTIPECTQYDPITTLKELHDIYRNWGLYLAMIGFKTQFPLLRGIWK